MDYYLDALNPRTFEQLIQSLARKILGNGLITFGDGPDGGREATFDGIAPFPSTGDRWDGKWIIQAKFKTRAANETPKSCYKWVEKEFRQEMEKFTSRKVKVEIPSNYLFFTNVVLTPTAGSGGRDKIEALAEKYKKKIPNIKIFGFDDVCGFLDNNRDVATAYSSFILSGDILQKLYDFLIAAKAANRNHCQLLGRFLEAEFREDLPSRLDHAGRLTTEKVHLEKVFVDLFATPDGIAPKEKGQKRFLDTCLAMGNFLLRPDSREGRLVLTGGPGCGKSTSTQFLCQVYRAYFLKNLDACASPLPELDEFIADFQCIIPAAPTCFRFPFRVILKDFAAWLAEQKKQNQNHSLLMYLKYRVEKKGPGSTIDIGEIIQLLGNLSFVFIFDGLDEVPVTSNRQEVLTEIRNFIEIDLRRCDCDALVIATTRPQGYANEFDRSRFSHLTITDMQEEDCLVYLDRLLKVIDEAEGEREKHLDILNKALAHDMTASLMKTPLQVSIMAILVKSGGEPPRYKYDLFTEYYTTIVKRERQKNVCRILNEYPEYIDHFHNQLGFTLQLAAEQNENPAAHISHAEFSALVSAYLAGQGFSKQEVEEKTAQLLEAAIKRLVFLDEVADGRIGFNIRSLQEYFAANYYVKNQPDDILRARLMAMSKSAYWRNTFLFALGYIYKHKNYLVDSVESLCREFNGSADLPGSISGSAVCKLGAWLALDILVEGIFRGNPLYENKFAGLLGELFTISPSYKHSRFGSLPDDIKQKWILPLIGKYTAQGVYEDQLVAWTIGIYLLKRNDEPVKAVMDQNWPSGVAEVKLVKHFIKLHVREDQWFMEKFLLALKRNPPFAFYEELSHSKFFYKAVISSANEFDILRILIQNFFVYGTPKFTVTKYMNDVINHLMGGLFKKIIHYNRITPFYNEDDAIEILLTHSGHKLKTYRVKSTHKNMDELIQLFSNHKIEYLYRLMHFLKSPDKNSLIDFFSSLKAEPRDSTAFIKSRLGKINWLLAKILNEEECLDKILQDIEDNRYGDTSDWQEFEGRILKKGIKSEDVDILNYPSRIIFDDEAPEIFESFYTHYYLEYKDDPNLKTKDGLYLQILYCTLAWVYNEIESFNKYLAGNESIVSELFIWLKKVKPDNLVEGQFNYIIFGLLYCLEDHDVMKFERQQREIVEKLKFHEKYWEDIDEEVVSAVFSKLAKTINYTLSEHHESGIIRVLIWTLLNPELDEIPPLEFNFKALHQASFKAPDNEACRILLCLFDPKMNMAKAHCLTEASKPLLDSLPQLPGLALKLIDKFNLKGDWVEPFLLEVYPMVDRHDHEQKTDFENYFKDLLESRLSRLHEPEVQSRLSFTVK